MATSYEESETIIQAPLAQEECTKMPEYDLPANTDEVGSTPKVSKSTIMAVFFMGLSYVAPITCGLSLPSGILTQIGTDLSDTANIAWIPSGWSVASAVSFAIAGNLSDIFGRRYILLSGQLIVLFGSIISATAQKTTIVTAGTSIIGFGAGFIFVSYPGITEILPNKYRGIGLGWTEFCIAIPWGVAGVLVANELCVHASWRWVFYIAIIYSVVVIIGTAVFYFPPFRPRNDYGKSGWQEFTELDFVGVFLFATGLSVFLVGLAYLGTSAYSTPLVASTMALGGITFIASVAYDFTIAKNPIFPLHLFAMARKFTVHLVILFIAGMIWQAVSTLAPQATLYIFTNSSVQLGVLQIPNNMAGVLGGWILPSLVHKIKHIRVQIILALVLQTVFTACYVVVLPDNKVAWSVFQLFGQCCFTWVTTLAYLSTGLFVPQEELGVSAGLIGTSRSAGGSVGNAIFSTILTSIINKRLASYISKAATENGFPADAGELHKLVPAVVENAVGIPDAFVGLAGASPAVIAATSQALKDAYVYAFKMVFLSTIPFGVAAIVAAWFVEDASHLLNNQVAVQQEKEVLDRTAQSKTEV